MMFPKHSYIRSPKLLRACRLMACQYCGADDGTVCAAHSNQSVHNKAKGIKADDFAVAALCHTCHYDVDQGRTLSRAERVKLWTDAHRKTVRELIRQGLWPDGIQPPNIV